MTAMATVCVVVILLVLERTQSLGRVPTQIRYRWLTNIGLMLLGGVTVSLLVGVDAISVAAETEGGLFHSWSMPAALEVVLSFLLIDLWRYWEHRVFHEVPMLWRAHLVHHSDTGLDVTTAERHHPIESIFVICTTLLLVFAFGISAEALALYISVATLSALVTHANIQLPEGIERHLRRWLVTPSVHALHHSDFKPQTDSNFGTVLSVWDRLFDTYSDPFKQKVNRFGLEYFHLKEDQALGPVLLQPFEYHSTMRYPQRDTDDEAAGKKAGRQLNDAWRRACVSLAIGMLLALLALWPTLISMTQIWGNSEPYQYAWLVVPMFLYLVGWHYRDRILSFTPRPDLFGVLMILAAVLLWCAAYAVDIRLGQHLALVLVLQGVVLSAVGRRIFWEFLPVIALLFFIIPCGDLLQPFLRNLTVKWIEWLAWLLQAPIRIDGFMAYVGQHRYVVLDACSGLSFVTLAAFLGYSFGLLIFRSMRLVLALSAIGAIIGIFTNALRVWMIIGIDWMRGSQMDMSAHMNLQWLALLTALGFLFYYTNRLLEDFEGEACHQLKPDATGDWRSTQAAPLLAGLLVATVTLPVQVSFARAGHETMAGSLERIARVYDNSSWLSAESAGDRSLLIPTDNRMDIIVSQTIGKSGRPDLSRLKPEDSTAWRHSGSDNLAVCDAGSCVEFVHYTWSKKGSEGLRHTLYSYYVGGVTTPSKLKYRLLRGWSLVLGDSVPTGLIGFRTQGQIPEYADINQQFLNIHSQLLRR